ncbi:hypothetical protein bsdtw1_04604 [Clostridium fungisolvens]|uniref:Uncharacterized protein n=1 Tax=Clostridium fungisolvens TaxID=1604897 RepID=A0A6V8SP89_9CLOT|nr:hypothetical protein bsdtw1_04604 [Clostridium fungisolvens]
MENIFGDNHYLPIEAIRFMVYYYMSCFKNKKDEQSV